MEKSQLRWSKHTSYSFSEKSTIFLLLLFHFTGLIGISMPESRAWFLMATPLTLCLSTFLLLRHHQDWNMSFMLFCCIAFATGMAVEIVGVATGILFGSYHYGPVLGWKWMDVPLVMGITWLLCIYCSGVVAQFLVEKLTDWRSITPIPKESLNRVVKHRIPVGTIFLGASLMLALDLLLEPVAIKFSFWYWKDNVVPVQNYVVWFVTSLALLFTFFSLPFSKKNPIALILYPILIVFFGLLSLSSR